MSSAWGKGREHAGGRRLGQGLEDQKSGRRRDMSARMGLEVRGALMNTPQQKVIPNVMMILI